MPGITRYSSSPSMPSPRTHPLLRHNTTTNFMPSSWSWESVTASANRSATVARSFSRHSIRQLGHTVQRQPENKNGAFSQIAFHLDSSTMRDEYRFGNSKPHAASFHPLAFMATAKKFVED